MASTTLTEQDKIFYSDGYRMAQSVIEKGINKEKQFQITKEIYTSIDQLIDSIYNMAQKQGIEIHCKAGCAYCCHQAVFAASHEFEYLADYINMYLSKQEIKGIRERAIEKNNKVAPLAYDDMLKNKEACPLLEDGKCMAYEARPMGCRIYLSMKLASCVEFFNNPENKENYPALLEFPLQAGRMLNEGFIAGLKSGGKESVELRVEEGVINIL